MLAAQRLAERTTTGKNRGRGRFRSPKGVSQQFLTKDVRLRTPQPNLVAGRNGSADRRAGETDRRVGGSAKRPVEHKEWSPRNTRKGMRGVSWEAHVTSRDPTLDAVGTRSCAIRRRMSKKRATAIFDLPFSQRGQRIQRIQRGQVHLSGRFGETITAACRKAVPQLPLLFWQKILSEVFLRKRKLAIQVDV
jgi:hypothetical protein